MRRISNGRKGRPAESTEDEELDRRRHRGRVAQQAFRQRQLDAISRLEGELASLKGSLGDINLLAERLDGSLSAVRLTSPNRAFSPAIGQTMNELLAKLKHVTKLSNDTAKKGTAESPLNTTLTSASNMGELNATSVRPTARQISSPRFSPNSSATNLVMSGTIERNSFDQESSISNHTRNLGLKPTLNGCSGRLSPRLNYGLWFEPDLGLPIIVPPEDIIPFLNHAESPFVVKLYWRTLFLALSVLRNQRRRRGQMSPETALLTQRIFGTCLQYDSGEVIAASIHARLGFRLRGKIEATHPGRDPTNALRLYNMVQADLSMRGQTMQNWLDARQVERLIGEVYGLGQVMLLQAASMAAADAATIQKTTRLVEGLARHSVCFGDGPRYPVQAVTAILQLLFDERPEVVMGVEAVY